MTDARVTTADEMEMAKALQQLAATIPNFAQWTKQERIAFLFWYFRMIITDGEVDGAIESEVLKKGQLKTYVRLNAWIGLTPDEVDGGKFFAELTDGKRQKPLLERVGAGRYRLTERGRERFRKYEDTLKLLRGEEAAARQRGARPED